MIYCKKYVTKDYLTHHKVINESEDKIYIENHHEGIISRKCGIWHRLNCKGEVWIKALRKSIPTDIGAAVR